MNHLQLLADRFGGALLVRPVQAGQVINLSKQSTYNRCSAGTFPLPLVETTYGRMVRLTDIADYLNTLQPIQPKPSPPTVTKGRPRKTEEVEARRRGLSVHELRAQKSIQWV